MSSLSLMFPGGIPCSAAIEVLRCVNPPHWVQAWLPFGLLVLGSMFISTPAQAEVLTPRALEFGPHSSSVAGGQILEVYGENLFGVVKMTFGGVESPIAIGDEYYGEAAAAIIPAHKAGTVPVILYLDADTVVTDPTGGPRDRGRRSPTRNPSSRSPW
ncbi:hypothetical protein D1871_15285 [Nakamurella silvestris]|nr:hypothetical protein D1871_15285 [Nakamurella silvestris]